MGNQREQEPRAGAAPMPAVLTGSEAVLRVEGAILGSAPARDPAVAEGLALAGVRAASVSPGIAVSPASECCSVEASCVHHVTGEPGQALPYAAFEFAATSAQEAVDHCLAAHLLSHTLGRPGLCSLSPSLANDLALLQLPDEALLAARLAAATGTRLTDRFPICRMVRRLAPLDHPRVQVSRTPVPRHTAGRAHARGGTGPS